MASTMLGAPEVRTRAGEKYGTLVVFFHAVGQDEPIAGPCLSLQTAMDHLDRLFHEAYNAAVSRQEFRVDFRAWSAVQERLQALSSQDKLPGTVGPLEEMLLLLIKANQPIPWDKL